MGEVVLPPPSMVLESFLTENGFCDVNAERRSPCGMRLPSGPAEPALASCLDASLRKKPASDPQPTVAVSGKPMRTAAAACRPDSPMKVRLPEERALPTLLQVEMRRHQLSPQPTAFAPQPRKREWGPVQSQVTSDACTVPVGQVAPEGRPHHRQSKLDVHLQSSSKASAWNAEAAMNSSASLSSKQSRCVQSQLLMLAQDQHGSGILISQLEAADMHDLAKVFEGILLVASRLVWDPHGHAVILQLFSIGTAEQKRALAQRLRGLVLRLSKDRYGCWVIQKALETVPLDVQVQLAKELQTHVSELVGSMHGNFVIQKCIEQVPQESVPFIAREIEECAERIASHMYGCRAVQRLFEHCSPTQLCGIKEKIIACTSRLARDTYGNNVVRHLLNHGSEDDKRQIIQVMRSDVLEFAKNKSSSLVLEKCVEIVTSDDHARFLEEERAALMHELLEGKGGSNPPVQQIMLDRFGNYIVQRLIERCRGPERELLWRRLVAAEPRLRRSSNGKHILAVMQREFGQL
mmetsp:Transcript_102435/g.298736  ORF Transcript_102435/g.298736 Transcript_102435/m.298736 type:complete len:521 (-) Transcript_102435:212-1774(-)